MKITPPTFLSIKKIIIGSTNPVKINCAQKVMQKIYPNAKFEGKAVKSGVSNQPKSDEESRLGAHNRAQNILKNTDADIAVGLEGGVTQTNLGMFTNAWCCIADRNNKVSYGGGMHFHLPKYIANKIKNGAELGPIMDSLINEQNWKTKGGAIEIFSSGMLTRTKAYERLVELALTRFVAEKWYYDI